VSTSSSEIIWSSVFTSSSPRKLTNVVVTLSSWACVSGAWTSGDCNTPAGSTFSQAVTLKIYSTDGWVSGTPLATSTQSFNVPYRPSASSICGDGRWYSGGAKSCFNGLASDVTFNFAGNVTLPDTVVYSISYNSTHYGPSPIGEGAACYGTVAGCPYDSLNIALNNTPGTVLGYAYYWGVFPGYTPAVQFKAGGGGS